MAQNVTLISKAAPTPLTDDVKEQNLIQSTPGGHGHSLGHGMCVTQTKIPNASLHVYIHCLMCLYLSLAGVALSCIYVSLM